MLIDRQPGTEVLGQITLLGAGANNPPEGVKYTAEFVDALADILGQQTRDTQDKLPSFGVGDIAGVGLASNHTRYNDDDWTKVHTRSKREISDQTSRRWLRTDVEDRVVHLNQMLLGWSNNFYRGPVSARIELSTAMPATGSVSGIGGSTS